MAGFRTEVRGVRPIRAATPPREEVGPSAAAEGRRSRRWIPVVWLVAVVLLCGAAGVAAWQVRQLHRLDESRTQALEEARVRVPLLLSYRSATLEEDLDTALEQTAGGFAEEYRQLVDEVVTPTATERGISTEATVSASGVVRAEEDEVVVLVFLTQTTTTARSRNPAVSGSRVEVTMQPVGDDWKIAGFDPR